MLKLRKPSLRGFSVLIKAVAARWPELLPLMNDEKQLTLQSTDFKKAVKHLRELPDDPLYAEYSKLKNQLPNGVPIGKARLARQAALTVEPPAKRLRTVQTINNSLEANVPEPVLQPVLQPVLEPVHQPVAAPELLSSTVLRTDFQAMLDSANNQWSGVLLMTERLYSENATLREHNVQLQENLTLTEAIYAENASLRVQLQEEGRATSARAEQLLALQNQCKVEAKERAASEQRVLNIMTRYEGARADIVALEDLNTRLQEELLALQNKCSTEAKERAASEQRMLEIMTMNANRFNLSLPSASLVTQPLPTGIPLNPDGPSAFVAELSSFLNSKKTPEIRRADGAMLLATTAYKLFQTFLNSRTSYAVCPTFPEFKDIMKNSFQFEVWFCSAVTHDGMQYPAGDYFVHVQQSIANQSMGLNK